MSQTELAADLQVGQQAVSRWESGRVVPRPTGLLALAARLDIDPAELFVLAGYPTAAAPHGIVLPEGEIHQLPDAALWDLAEHVLDELRDRHLHHNDV